MELSILNCRIPLEEHPASEPPAEQRHRVAAVQLEDDERLHAAIWNGEEWRDNKRRPFNSPIRRWFSIGGRHVSK